MPLADKNHFQINYQVVHSVTGRFRLRIHRLQCDREYASKLAWLVESFAFVLSWRINPEARSIVVNYDPSLITSAQVEQHLATAIQQASLANTPSGTLTKLEFDSEINWGRLGLSVVSLGISILASLALPIPALAIAGAIAIAALPIFTSAFNIIRERRFNTDILDAFWIGFHTISGDFVTPTLTLSLIESGDALRNTTAQAASRALELLNDLDEYVWIERRGKKQRLPLKQVQIGDRVIVHSGELIAVDGHILHGEALIDEHKLTGESALSFRSQGQTVHACTLVVEGKLCIIAEQIGSNTRAGLAQELMQTAPVYDTRIENYAAKVADAAIVPTLCLSATIFALTGDTTRAIAPLQLDFCNGIAIAVPTTILTSLAHAARNGVYIRNGRALEVLSRIDTVVFDKTGTLTQGNAAVVDILTNEATFSQVLSLAASAEQGNTHPIARAIVRCAQENNVELHHCECNYQVGLGITAQSEGQEILVGSNNLMQQAGVNLDLIHQRYPELKISSNSLVYVASNSELLGVILLTDPVRPEVKSAIATLHAQGIDTYMLSGNRQGAAKEVAYKSGIDPTQTYAEVLPQEKIEMICWLRHRGRTVAFVGDGINDAAALAHADVSVSFASGCNLARETADVVLLDDDLAGLTEAIEIAKKAMEIIYLNTAIAVIPNVSIAIAGIIFALDPILEVIVSNAAAIIAELNSFQPLFFEPRKKSNTIPNSTDTVDKALLNTRELLKTEHF